MYTFEDYKKELLNYVLRNGYDPTKIAKMSFDLFMDHQREVDSNLYEIMLDIANMEMGPEFELDEKEFYSYISEQEKLINLKQ